MINSSDVDIQKCIQQYGMKNVLESIILYLGYTTDYEIQLKVALRKALENYEKRYDEANNGDDDKEITCAIPPPPKQKLKSNSVICLACGMVLESVYRHDFQKCDCENETFVDGGLDYQRVGGMDLSKVKVL